jgi:hypothetical protein
VLDRAARRLFGPAAWAFYSGSALACALVFAFSASLRPTWRDAWFLEDPILSVLAYWPVSYALAALHEAWHWLAGRAVGAPARFRISNRGVYLVFETDLTHLVALPRRRRYGPFLAGMAIDTVVLAAALGLRLLDSEGAVRLPRLLDDLLGAAVLYQLLGIVWQWAALFMRNDGYAVLANALGGAGEQRAPCADRAGHHRHAPCSWSHSSQLAVRSCRYRWGSPQSAVADEEARPWPTRRRKPDQSRAPPRSAGRCTCLRSRSPRP